MVRAAVSRAGKSHRPGKIMAAWNEQQYPAEKLSSLENDGSMGRAAASREKELSPLAKLWQPGTRSSIPRGKSTAPGKIMAAWDAQQYPVKKKK